MSDDNLPEDPTQPENETETPESSMLPRRSRGNRRDEEEVVEPDRIDKLRERVSSTTSLIIAVGVIVIAAVVAGWINQEDGPAEVDDTWNTVNAEILKIREETRGGTFDIVEYELTVNDAAPNPVAKGYLQLELGTAGLKVAIGDNQPQFSQAKPQILFGDEAAIASRVGQLNEALEQLTEAIESFTQAKPSDNPLIDLGIYRANYSAAFIQEALMILDSSTEFESHRDDAITHLNQAKQALPQLASIDVAANRSSTDQAIKVLNDQIDERVKAIETLASKTFDPENPESDAAKEEYFYSWLSTYIKDRHASEAAAAGTDTTPDSPILPPTLTDPDRESAFPINNDDSNGADATDDSNEATPEDADESPEESTDTPEVKEDGDEQ